MVISINQLLDEDIAEEKKALSDLAKKTNSLTKRISKAIESGDLGSLTTTLTQIKELPQKQAEIYERLSAKIAQFDYREYSRELFHQELIEACQKENIRIEGTFPCYEVFPFLVKIDPDGPFAKVNDKKVVALRPSALAKEIKKEQMALYKEAFNARDFLKTLSSIYEILSLQQREKHNAQSQDIPIPIKQVYAAITPLRRWAREYPLRFFAFDMHRLLCSGQMEIDGRRCVFGSARNIKNAIRILDETGKERFIGSLSFQKI